MSRLYLFASFLALITCAAAPASSQQWPTCNPGSNEVFLVVDDPEAVFVVSAMDDDGNPLTRIDEFNNVVVVSDTVDARTNVEGGPCDWIAETNGVGSPGVDVRDMSADRLWTLQFDQIAGFDQAGKETEFPTYRYTYYACGTASNVAKYGFFCPNVGLSAAGFDGDMYFVATGNQFYAFPAALQTEFGTGSGCKVGTGTNSDCVSGIAEAVSYTIGGGTYLMPYNMDMLCLHPDIDCSPSAVKWSIFLSGKADSPSTPLASTWTFPSTLTMRSEQTWYWGPQTVQMLSGDAINVRGTFDASGTTIRANNAAFGWAGIDVEFGSTALLDSVTVAGVAGTGAYMVDIEDGAASVRITDSFIQNPASGGYMNGIRASGASLDVGPTTENVYIARTEVTGMDGDGITLASGAAARLYDNFVSGNGGDGIVVGYNAEAFVSRPPNLDPDASNRVTGNGGYGAYATLGADVTTGFYYYPVGGYTPEGRNLVTGNATGGIHAAHSLSQHFNNSFLENGPPGSQWFDGFGPDASAAGSGASVYARNDWWGRPTNPDTTSLASGAYDAFVAVDPMLSAAPGSGSLRENRSVTSANKGDGASGARGLYLAAAETSTVASLDGVLAVAAGRPEAAQAMGDLARLAGRGLVSEIDAALAVTILEREASGARADHREWALQGLVKVHHLQGRRAEALQAATALVSEGGDGELYGRVARAHLLAEMGDAEGAAAEAAAVAARASGSREARLVLAALAAEAVESSAPSPKASPLATAVEPAPALGAPYPNPTAGGAQVPFTLSAETDVHLAVYDALGREVATLARGPHPSGAHSARLGGRALAPGVYLVRLSVGDGDVDTRRLTVAR